MPQAVGYSASVVRHPQRPVIRSRDPELRRLLGFSAPDDGDQPTMPALPRSPVLAGGMARQPAFA